jgi:hypothetical protein
MQTKAFHTFHTFRSVIPHVFLSQQESQLLGDHKNPVARQKTRKRTFGVQEMHALKDIFAWVRLQPSFSKIVTSFLHVPFCNYDLDSTLV